MWLNFLLAQLLRPRGGIGGSQFGPSIVQSVASIRFAPISSSDHRRKRESLRHRPVALIAGSSSRRLGLSSVRRPSALIMFIVDFWSGSFFNLVLLLDCSWWITNLPGIATIRVFFGGFTVFFFSLLVFALLWVLLKWCLLLSVYKSLFIWFLCGSARLLYNG